MPVLPLHVYETLEPERVRNRTTIHNLPTSLSQDSDVEGWSVAVMSQWLPIASAEMRSAAVIQPGEARRRAEAFPAGAGRAARPHTPASTRPAAEAAHPFFLALGLPRDQSSESRRAPRDSGRASGWHLRGRGTPPSGAV
jgi:hypothetical protein